MQQPVVGRRLRPFWCAPAATARAAIAVRAKMRMGQSAQRCDIAYVIVRVNVRCAYVLLQVVSTEHVEYDCDACVRACR